MRADDRGQGARILRDEVALDDPIRALLVQLADPRPAQPGGPEAEPEGPAGVAGLFAALLSATTDAVLLTDPAGTVRLANPRAEQMFGQPAGDLVGVPLGALLPEDGEGRRARQLDGASFAVEVVTRPAPGGWAVHTLRDRAEDAGQGGHELRVQLLHLASHELREPLRMVRSYAELLERRLSGIDAAERGLLVHLTRAARRLLRMNDDLQAYIELDRPLDGVRPIDLDAVVRRVLDELSPRVAETGAVVQVDPLPTVHADPERLALVFRHLIENALRFVRAGESPSVKITAAPAEGGGWQVAVRDQGIGIEPQYVHRLFQPFQRLHARGERGGSGLGLAICRQAVEAHGGTIGVESNPDEGATIRFTLPDPEARA